MEINQQSQLPLNRLSLQHIRLKYTNRYQSNKQPLTYEQILSQVRKKKTQLLDNQPKHKQLNHFKSVQLPRISNRRSLTINQQQIQEQQQQKNTPRPRGNNINDFIIETKPKRQRFRTQSTKQQDHDEIQFKNAFVKVPQQLKLRKYRNMESLIKFLKKNNAFFKNISEILILHLLKVSSLTIYESMDTIYNRKEKPISIYVILFGKVKIFDPYYEYSKVCITGETISEQLIFSREVRTESVKAISSVYLLELTTKDFRKLGEKAIQIGEKQGYEYFIDMLRQNFILKQSMKKKQ